VDIEIINSTLESVGCNVEVRNGDRKVEAVVMKEAGN